MQAKSKKPPVSRSELIRQLLQEEPKATAGRIVKLAAERGTSVTTQLVYNVVSVLRKNKGKRAQSNGKRSSPIVSTPALTAPQPHRNGRKTVEAGMVRKEKDLQPSPGSANPSVRGKELLQDTAAMIKMRQRWGEEVFNEMCDLASSQG